MFLNFVEYFEEKVDGKIVDLRFRDKKKGGELSWLSTTALQRERFEQGTLNRRKSTTITTYTKVCCFRESCYSCPYACGARLSDLTIGDFWGAVHYFEDLDTTEGVSVVIASTDKGKSLSIIVFFIANV